MSKRIRSYLSLFLTVILCLITCLKPCNTVCAEENTNHATIMLGDLDGDHVVKLNDAKLALQASLKIITLEETAFQAADLFDDGQVTLEDARNILLVALKIKSMDEILGVSTPTNQPEETQSPTDTPSMEPTSEPTTGEATELPEVPAELDYVAYVNEYLDIQVTTDKDAYVTGESIQLTITATNTGHTPIYMYQTYWRDELANVESQLMTVSGSVIESDFEKTSDGLVPVLPAIFQETLISGESVSVTRTIDIPVDLNFHSSEASAKEFCIKATFQYTDTDWNNRREYEETFPIKIKSKIADYPSYMDEYVDINVTPDKKQYKEGEIIRFTGTVTNNGLGDVPIFGTTTSFDKASCIRVKLLKNGEEVADAWDDIILNEEQYTGILESEEVLSFAGTMNIPVTTESVTADAVEMDDEYSIVVTLGYQNNLTDNTVPPKYSKIYPIVVKERTYYDDYIEQYLDFNITTDKSYYIQAENVNVTITVTNTGAEPVYMWNQERTDDLSNTCTFITDTYGNSIVDSMLARDNTNLNKRYLWNHSTYEYHTILNSGESITVQREIPLEYDIEEMYGIELSQEKFFLELAFKYANSDYSKASKDYYSITVPIKIEPEIVYDEYVKKNLKFSVETDKESYRPGESVHYTITLTNTGLEPIFFFSEYNTTIPKLFVNLIDSQGNYIMCFLGGFGGVPESFYDVLSPGESRIVQRTDILKDDLESLYSDISGDISQQEFFIDIKFRYRNNRPTKSKEINCKFPFKLILEN